jgi:hypothetical protein
MTHLLNENSVNEIVNNQDLVFLSDLITEINTNELPQYYDINMESSNDLETENLIFTCKYNWRVLRIISSKTQSNQPKISAHLAGAKELEIQVELSKEILPTLNLLIRMWLVEKISKQGLKIIMDFVANHSSSKKHKMLQQLNNNKLEEMEENNIPFSGKMEAVFN